MYEMKKDKQGNWFVSRTGLSDIVDLYKQAKKLIKKYLKNRKAIRCH